MSTVTNQSSQSPPRLEVGAKDKGNIKSDDLNCCVPEPTGGCIISLKLQEAVRVICSNAECSESGYMHQQCFNAWEESVLNYIKCRGRARSWTDAQRRSNLWTGKGYALAYKTCSCLCDHGYLKKDLDWKPPVALDTCQTINPGVDKKKKKRDKTNLRPKLNYNVRESYGALDIQQISDDMGQIKRENNGTIIKPADTKIKIVPRIYDGIENDGWSEEDLRKSTGVVVKWNTDGYDSGKGFIRDNHYSNRWIHACGFNFEETSNIDFTSIVGEQVEYMIKKLGHKRYEAININKCQMEISEPFKCLKTNCEKYETHSSHPLVMSPSNKEHYWKSKTKAVETRSLTLLDVEQSGMIAFWCPITNHGTIIRSDGVKFSAHINNFSPNQEIDEQFLVGCYVTFTSSDGTSAKKIEIPERNGAADCKYNKSYMGTIVYWNSVHGYGFVKSQDIEERAFLFLGSFSNKVDVNSLYGRNIKFQLKQHENQNMQDIVINAVITDAEYQIRTRSISEPILIRKLPQKEKPLATVHCQSTSLLSSRATQIISQYRFFGTIVTYKPAEAYGFIRSYQVTGDVFFNVSDFPSVKEKFCELVGTNVFFVIYDVGKKSMEARSITFANRLDKANKTTGIVTRWDHTGSGYIKPNMEFCSELVLLSHREIKCENNVIQVGIEVEFTIFLNYNGLFEARDVKLVEDIGTYRVKSRFKSIIPPRFSAAKAKAAAEKNYVPHEGIYQKGAEVVIEVPRNLDFEELTDKKKNRELIKSISVMSEEKLVEMFNLLKGFLSTLIVNATGSQTVAVLLKRSAIIGSQVENKIIRMLTSEFCQFADNKYGCFVLDAALKSSNDHKAMLVEKMLELDYSQLFKLWVHGGSFFIRALQQLDQDQKEALVSTQVNHCCCLATHSKNHGALRSILLELGNEPCIEELVMELEPILLELAEHKCGWLIVEALAQNPRDNVREIISKLFVGRVKELAANEIACKVVEAAVRHGTKQQQQCWIEEVCSLDASQAEKPVLWLAKHQHGHKVVLAMLQVSTNRQIHGDLKASILFKQEDLMQNQYGKKILQMIKIEQ